MISRSLLIVVGGLAAAFVAGLVTIVAVQQHTPYRQHRIGGAFAMTEMTGKPVSDHDLLGRPTAITFGFTACPDVCPTTLLMLTDAMRRLGADADKLNVVFVTVDPRRDTSAAMKLYLSSFDPRIRGLTGTDAQVAAMADAYHVAYRRVPTGDGGYTMDHTAGVLLFDARGRLAGQIPYDETPDRAYAKLATLVQPDACLPGGPPRVDLWSGAALNACRAS